MNNTPRLGHEPIAMRKVADYHAMERRGDFFWEIRDIDKVRFLSLAIPATPSDWSDWEFIAVQVCQSQTDKRPRVWLWDGNEEKPTLSPSIHTHEIWHGWVKGGVMSEA